MCDNKHRTLLSACNEGDKTKLIVALGEFFTVDNYVVFSEIVYRKSGDGLLHVLARYGHIDCLSLLLMEWDGRDHVNIEQRNLDGKTALHEAAQSSQGETVKLLLSAGAKVDQLKRADWTPLMLAVTKVGNVDVVRHLTAAGADLHLANKGLLPFL